MSDSAIAQMNKIVGEAVKAWRSKFTQPTEMGQNTLVAFFPNKLTREDALPLDDEGVSEHLNWLGSALRMAFQEGIVFAKGRQYHTICSASVVNVEDLTKAEDYIEWVKKGMRSAIIEECVEKGLFFETTKRLATEIEAEIFMSIDVALPTKKD